MPKLAPNTRVIEVTVAGEIFAYLDAVARANGMTRAAVARLAIHHLVGTLYDRESDRIEQGSARAPDTGYDILTLPGMGNPIGEAKRKAEEENTRPW